MSELSIAESIRQDYEEEIERLKIIEEKYKDSQLYIKDFKDEIERLNNIIKEVEKYLEERLEKLDIVGDDEIFTGIELALDKLQELKGSDNIE